MPEEPRRAFGADRLEAGEGGQIWLVCAAPKAWLPRQDKTLTRAEYPGTAVDWQGGVFEVLRAQPLADGGMRYCLAPWEEGHAIRRMEQYDAASETARRAESNDTMPVPSKNRCRSRLPENDRLFWLLPDPRVSPTDRKSASRPFQPRL